jgi:hypothetical protein
MTVPVDAEDAAEQGSAPAREAPHDPSPQPATHSARDAVGGTCPYLVSAGGSWRMAAPSREHRCAAVDPPAPQSTDKQRRHCLSSEHVECSIFRAARTARATTLAAGADPALVVAADDRRRPVARTAPVLLESPRLVDQAVRLQFDRAPGQIALIGLMVLAFAIVGLARLSGGGVPLPSSPGASAAAVAPSPSPRPTPTATPSIKPSVAPSASAGPSFRTTYTVKRGDTLLAIAKRFSTTAAKIRTLNGLTSSSLKVGQVLKIP